MSGWDRLYVAGAILAFGFIGLVVLVCILALVISQPIPMAVFALLCVLCWLIAPKVDELDIL